MDKEEIKKIQKYVGFTNQRMADWLKVSKPTYEAWLYGVNKIPYTHEIMLQALYQEVKNNNREEVYKAVGLGFAGLMALATGFLMSDKNENSDDEKKNGKYDD